MATISYEDSFIYSPDEVKLRDQIQQLFKSGVSREELLLFVDRALYSLVLCDWRVSDEKAQEILDVTTQAFILKRNLLGLIRNKESEYDPAKYKEYQSFYYNTVTKKKREEKRQLKRMEKENGQKDAG